MALSIEAVPVGRSAVRRAATPDGPATVRDATLDDLLARPDAWDDLLAGALEPQPYHGRTVLAAHRAAGLAAGVRCLAAARGARLTGLLPFRPGAARIGWRRANAAWSSPYTTSSRPLVGADDPVTALRALLDGMGSAANPLWLFPSFTTDDPFAALLFAELARRDWSAEGLDAFSRPVFRRPEPGTGGQTGLRKDLARRRRRLGERGSVALRTATVPDDLPAALDRFLRLEAAGWKGQRGTALGSRPATRALARALLDGPRGLLRIDELTLDGTPIASSVAFLAGDTAFLWKSAFDERFARFAPGILIEAAIVDDVSRRGPVARLNGCTRGGSPLDSLFPDRERVADLVVWARPGSRGRLDRLLRAERARRACISGVKSIGRRLLSPA